MGIGRVRHLFNHLRSAFGDSSDECDLSSHMWDTCTSSRSDKLAWCGSCRPTLHDHCSCRRSRRRPFVRNRMKAYLSKNFRQTLTASEILVLDLRLVSFLGRSSSPSSYGPRSTPFSSKSFHISSNFWLTSKNIELRWIFRIKHEKSKKNRIIIQIIVFCLQILSCTQIYVYCTIPTFPETTEQLNPTKKSDSLKTYQFSDFRSWLDPTWVPLSSFGGLSWFARVFTRFFRIWQ